ncbi:MAG: hypothetical protein IOD12_04360 [Silvanigrellales bacterium]|jgi:hypothetical protein|nr:hypothetical protein [Silvanigrellales bacterium]
MKLRRNDAMALSTLAAFACFAQSVPAYAGCNSDGSTCLWYAPLYNQNDSQLQAKWFQPGGGTNLCAPTAASMALKATIDLNKVKTTSGWVENSFVSASNIQRIENMATLFGTDPAKGTKNWRTYQEFKAFRSSLLWTFPWAPGVKLALLSTMEKYGSEIEFSTYKNFLQKPTAMITSYGHFEKYNVKMVSLPNLKYSEKGYSRDGGHVITPRGIVGSILYYNEPSGGSVDASRLAYVTPLNQSATNNGVTVQKVETLPAGASRMAYLDELQTSNYYPLLEGAMAIRFQ